MTGRIKLDRTDVTVTPVHDLRVRLGTFAVHSSVNGHAQAAVIIASPVQFGGDRPRL